MPSPGSWNKSNNSQRHPVNEVAGGPSGAGNGHAALRAGIARLASHDWSNEGDVEQLRATVEALIRLLADSGIVDEKVLGYRIEAALAGIDGNDPDNIPTTVLPSASRPVAAHGEIEAAMPRRRPRASTAPGFAGPVIATSIAGGSSAEFPLTDEIPTLASDTPALPAQSRDQALAGAAAVSEEVAPRGLALTEPAPAAERPPGPPLQPSKPVARFNPKAPTINTPAPAPRPVAPRVMRPAEAHQAVPAAAQQAPVAERPAAPAGATPNPAAARAIARITPRARPAVSHLPGMPERAWSESDDLETLARPALPAGEQRATPVKAQPAPRRAPAPASLDDSWTDLMPPRIDAVAAAAAAAAAKAQPAPAGSVPDSLPADFAAAADLALADLGPVTGPAAFAASEVTPVARPTPRPARTAQRRRTSKKQKPPQLFKSIIGTRTGEIPSVVACADCGKAIARWKRNDTDRGSLCNPCFDRHAG